MQGPGKDGYNPVAYDNLAYGHEWAVKWGPFEKSNILDRECPSITVYGDDYDTPDGTCISDYIHVTDLADAHVRALIYLEQGGDTTKFNLVNGKGFSVK